MNCNIILENIIRECKNRAGIKSIKIAYRDDVSIIESGDTCTVSGNLLEYYTNPQTSYFTFTKDIERHFYQNEISLQFASITSQNIIEIKKLLDADCVIVVTTNDDISFLLGKDNPVKLETLNINSGTSYGDFNGTKLSFIDISKEHPFLAIVDNEL